MYRDALTVYAIELKEGNRLPAPNFTVTDGMVDEIVRPHPREGRGAARFGRWRGRARSLRRELGLRSGALRVSAARWEFRRRMADDQQVPARRSRWPVPRPATPQDLLTLANTQRPPVERNR